MPLHDWGGHGDIIGRDVTICALSQLVFVVAQAVTQLVSVLCVRVTRVGDFDLLLSVAFIWLLHRLPVFSCDVLLVAFDFATS